MIHVNNKKIIRILSRKNLWSNRMRNLVAVIAIILTNILLTSIFTVGFSINETIQLGYFRSDGGYAHGTFQNLTKEQLKELKTDPLIKEYGLRRFVGLAQKEPFHKIQVEISYSDQTQSEWMFLKPKEGKFPTEGTREAATDTSILTLLGVEPVVGAQFTMTFLVDGVETTETFLLSGWWDLDKNTRSSHVIIPNSRAEEIYQKLETKGMDGRTSRWNMDVQFKNSVNIQGNINTILENSGYQNRNKEKENYIETKANLGYSRIPSQNNSVDPITFTMVSLLFLIICFTGYFIIYNVFQIAVAGDIRFYGLLKTIGTTPKQLKSMIQKQALILSAIGIPFGLFLGYLLGVVLTPFMLANFQNIGVNVISKTPVIFIGSALFSLFTVFLSCAKPAFMAARVSPVEAVRYVERSQVEKVQRNSKRFSLPKMAFLNLRRSKKKSVITILSLSFAMALLNFTFIFTNGFDYNKYLYDVKTDFILSENAYFQSKHWRGVPVEEDTIELLQRQGILDGGRVYGSVTSMKTFISKERFYSNRSDYIDTATINYYADNAEQLPDGRIANSFQLYGMEDFILDKITLLEGDLQKLKDPSGHYIAAVYREDDYNNPMLESHFAKLGETIVIRYIEETEFYNPATGAVYASEESIPLTVKYKERSSKYQDVEYEVAAPVTIPNSLTYRYYIYGQFILGAKAFMRDTQSSTVMYYAFDIEEGKRSEMERFLLDFTTKMQPQYGYESRETYNSEFGSVRDMFLLLGKFLSFVVGLVGVLNFSNTILTNTITRKKEFAMLQAIGMTGKQLKGMLIFESLYYTIGSVLICLAFYLLTNPFLGVALSNVFWFFTYQFTILPILFCVPLMLFLAVVVPYLAYQKLKKKSVVERLREME